MPRYRVNYTADVWESVVVEADSKEQAKTLFETHGEEYFEAREDEPEQMGMENVKVDLVEEI
jgi:shikimate kinase|tara:strand:+ start:477 stop:662 length:186 start_codon:yes stop_codon:yes gene_type:complete